MLSKTQTGIWETNAQALDLKNPRVLRWYVERKIAVGDWGALDRATVARLLPTLRLDPALKNILRAYVGHSHTRAPRRAQRSRKK